MITYIFQHLHFYDQIVSSSQLSILLIDKYTLNDQYQSQLSFTDSGRFWKKHVSIILYKK